MSKKTCSRCGIEKPLEDYNRHSRNLDGRASHCRACDRDRGGRYRAGLPAAWTRGKVARPIRERLLASSAINEETGCRIWQKATCVSGYGKLKVAGRMEKAHRISYQEFVGPIPDGLFVCHSCDVRNCIEPSHLFLGAPKDNTADMIDKGRNSRSGGGSPKLTLEQRTEIKESVRSGETIRSLSSRFGVSKSSIRYIANNDIRRVCASTVEASHDA